VIGSYIDFSHKERNPYRIGVFMVQVNNITCSQITFLQITLHELLGTSNCKVFFLPVGYLVIVTL